MRILLIFFIFISMLTVEADTLFADTVNKYQITPPDLGSQDERGEDKAPIKYNLAKVLTYSLLLPGLGQIYCGKKLRGSLFASALIINTMVLKNRRDNFREVLTDNLNFWRLKKDVYFDSLQLAGNNPLDTLVYKNYYNKFINAYMWLDLTSYRREVGRSAMHNIAGWIAGIYLWNILDALKCSNRFLNNEPRNPTTAAWLSAIPYLGLGQMYNGAFTKTGFIWTTHTMLTYMAIKYHRYMNDCLNKQNQVLNALSTDKHIIQENYAQWDLEYEKAFRKRNTYLWYLVLLYLYGIFDAAVDAHLHDYQEKIKLKPDMTIAHKSLKLKLQMCVDF